MNGIYIVYQGNRRTSRNKILPTKTKRIAGKLEFETCFVCTSAVKVNNIFLNHSRFLLEKINYDILQQ